MIDEDPLTILVSNRLLTVVSSCSWPKRETWDIHECLLSNHRGFTDANQRPSYLRDVLGTDGLAKKFTVASRELLRIHGRRLSNH